LVAPRARTVPEMLLSRIASTPEAEAYRYPDGSGWKALSWRQLGERVRNIACGLRALGLKDEQRCGILSGTRMDWVLADLGILCAAGATTTVYPSSTAEDIAYILKDSNTVICFAEDDEQVGKLTAKRAELPQLAHVITFDGKPSDDGYVITLGQLEEKGRAQHAAAPGQFEEVARSSKPEALATLIYTSGTTGRPKGVELTHGCWAYEGDGIDALGILRSDDVQYFWLPLAHSFGKMLIAAQLKIGFRTAIDGRHDKLVENLGVIKPTFVAAVPRIFEKVYNKVIANAKAGGAAKYGIFRWAIDVGRQVSRLKQQRRMPGPVLMLKYKVAEKLVFSKLQERFGGRLRFFVSGSAPLSRDIAEFFHAAGILILEGYGLTETSAAVTVNLPDNFEFGTVGPPLPGTEIKIAPEDGEVLIRGPSVMRGYHGLAEASAEALDKDGWLHTGDIGELHNGLLKITDRKKDLIKTSGGKYVAPQSIEAKIKMLCPYVSQAVVHGNNRNYCSALVTLDEEAIKAWAKDNGLGSMSYTDLTKEPRVRALLEPYFEQLNGQLANYESIKKWAILPKDLSLEAGEVTPSMKIKRKAVEQNYKALIDSFYSGSVAQV
jgi:long-chain acyl-CoA synthetase